MINAPVLVLNQNYEPLNVCDIRRAFTLLGADKAELLERNHQVIHTPTLAIAAPSVIRLIYLVKRPRPRVKLSRREVFARDRHTCQYCGAASRDLTIDHVTPKHRGGRHEWENLVAACRNCNHRKGSKTLAEARMALLREPRAPRADVRYLFGSYLADEQNDPWRSYLFLSDARSCAAPDRCRPAPLTGERSSWASFPTRWWASCADWLTPGTRPRLLEARCATCCAAAHRETGTSPRRRRLRRLPGSSRAPPGRTRSAR